MSEWLTASGLGSIADLKQEMSLKEYLASIQMWIF